MLPPWDSLSELQAYQDWLNRILVWAGGVFGLTAALVAVFMGNYQIRISNRIGELEAEKRRQEQEASDVEADKREAEWAAQIVAAERKIKELQPKPTTTRLRALLNEISPEILPALQNGTTQFKLGRLLVHQYDALKAIQAEDSGGELIVVGPISVTAATDRGLAYEDISLSLRPRVLVDDPAAE